MDKKLSGKPDEKSQERAYHRPVGIRVQKVGPVPHVRHLPTETEMTINCYFSREQAQAMVEYLQGELSKPWLEVIPVEITGPSP